MLVLSRQQALHRRSRRARPAAGPTLARCAPRAIHLPAIIVLGFVRTKWPMTGATVAGP
jgi:hypothetical protein